MAMLNRPSPQEARSGQGQDEGRYVGRCASIRHRYRLQLQHNSARSARYFNGSHPTQVGKEPENNKLTEAIIKTQEKKVER
jgi:hypothetical protein